MATKAKESGVQSLSFWTTGEDMTRTARDFWVSNNITGAINLCLDGLGMNEEQALQLLTGKMKLIGSTREGDGTLGGVDDNAVEFHGCSLTIEERIFRLEEKFVDDSNCRLDAKRRLGFGVHEASNPLHPIKIYATLQGALNYLEKQDEL